ncbi:CARDB domain-containing protein [Nonomuraea sp. NPDC050310]|uniref:COG1361 S-layer family protein n=1 Tax=unclassified Nonomuraea TaxID=2593643 RepID=UPI0033C61035
MTVAILVVLALSVLPFGGGARAAQLQVTKTVSPDPMIIGAESVYTLTVRNTGDTPATDVVVTDTLDPNLTPGALPAGCTASGQTVTCGGPGTAIPPGGELTLSIPVTVDSALADGTNLRNGFTADGSNTAPATGQLISQTRTVTDVEITKSGPATVEQDGTITYTVVVVNHGPSDAVDVTVQDPTDGNLTEIVDLPAECPASGLTVSCPLGRLKPGERREFTFTVRVRAPGGTQIDNCATVYTGSRENETGNNVSCVSTVVQPPPPITGGEPDLDLDKSGPAVARPGDTYEYTVVIANDGDATAENVVVTDLVDGKLTVADLPPGCALAGGTVRCSVGDLAPGESRTLTFGVRVSSGGDGDVIRNCAVGTTTTANRGGRGAECVSTEIDGPAPSPSPTPSPSGSPTPRPTSSEPGPSTDGPGKRGHAGDGPRHRPHGDVLPMTGAPVALGVAGAVGLIAAGVGLRLVARRRGRAA